jgi:hypothetical protein
VIPLEWVVWGGAILGTAGLLLEMAIDAGRFVREGESFEWSRGLC